MVEATARRPGISLDEWYPLVKGRVQTPKTGVVRAPCDLMPAAYAGDGSENDPTVRAALDGIEPTAAALVREAERLGLEYPVFVRSGLTSGKHGWLDTCFVPDALSMAKHLWGIIEYSAMADFIGLPCDVWVVREMLSTEPAFHWFSGSMPITRERRYFVRDGALLGWHPYWPPGAFDVEGSEALGVRGEPLVGELRSKLEALNAVTDDEVAVLSGLSRKVSALVPGAWSVDWLWVSGHGWYLTDMAWAEASYIWEDYPSAPKGLR